MNFGNFTRRQFGKAFAGSLAASGLAGAAPDATISPRDFHRQVWVGSVCMSGIKDKDPKDVCSKILDRMEEMTPYRPDIICTPETFPYANYGGKPNLTEVAEDRSGTILDRFADFARRHQCYVVCSTYIKDAGKPYNAAVLLDRQGKYVGEYRKINPDENEIAHGVTPGPLQPPTFDADFGRIGMQICYDVNWYGNWHKLGDAGAKIVFYPSFFAGGMMLNSHAWMNKYFVVSSILNGDPSKIVDPLGEEIVATGRAGNWICAPLNMDYAIIQTMDNLKKAECITKKYGRDFRIRVLHVEALAMIQGISGDRSVKEVLKEFDIPTTREQFAAATELQNSRRPG